MEDKVQIIAGFIHVEGSPSRCALNKVITYGKAENKTVLNVTADSSGDQGYIFLDCSVEELDAAIARYKNNSPMHWIEAYIRDACNNFSQEMTNISQNIAKLRI